RDSQRVSSFVDGADLPQALARFVSLASEDGRAHATVDRDLSDALFAHSGDFDNRPADRRKIVVVVTSNAPDTSGSIHAAHETIERLAERGIQAYAILIGQFFPFAPTSALRSYVEPTGGEVYRATSPKALEAAFMEIVDHARHQYLLSYVSDNHRTSALA